MPTIEPEVVLDDATKALIDQLIASYLEYSNGENEDPSSVWHPELGPSQIGASYHDYEDPLTECERYLLEHPNAGEPAGGWCPPDDQAGAPPKGQICEVAWDQDTMTSDDYKQDRIMEAQHGQVMEERALNGLRMPSPSPKAQEGRIAVIAMSLRARSVQPRSSILSPQAAEIMPLSRPFQPRGRPRRSHHHRSDNVAHDCSRLRSSLVHWCPPTPLNVSKDDPCHWQWHDKDASRSSRRGRSCEDQLNIGRHGLAAGKRSSSILSKSMNDIRRPVKIDLNDSNGQKQGKLRRMTTPSRLSDPLQRSQSLPQKSDAHSLSETQLTPTHLRSRFSERLMVEDVEAESVDSESPTPRPPKTKGKGKERASSPSPSPKAPGVSSKAVHSLFDTDAVYDRELGEYVVHIPWSYRDPVQDRISDSRVTEIYLGEDEGDECEIRVLSGVVGVGDFFEDDAGRGSSGIDELGGGDERNDGWLDRDMTKGMRKNERLVLGGF